MDFSKDKHVDNIFFQSVFILSDYLLEIGGIHIILFVLISLIEFIQICFFFINHIFENYWNIDIIFNGISTLIKYFWLEQIFTSKNDFNGFIIIFYFLFVLLILFYIDLIIILFLLNRNYPIPISFQYYFKYYANILLSILFFPSFSSFITVFICKKESNSSKYTNFSFPSQECYKGSQIAHCAFGVMGVIMILLCGYLLSTLFYETNPKSKNIKARFSSNYEFVFFIFKILWVLIYHLSSYFSKERLWIMATTNLLISLAITLFLIKEKPFYSTIINKFLLIFRSIEFITALILFIAKVLGNKNFEGEWIMFFLGIILSIGVIILYPENKFDIIILSMESIKDENVFQKKLIYALELIENQDKMEFELFLKGSIITNSNASEKSRYLDNVKAKIESIAKSPNEKSKKHIEEYYAFQKYFKECYQKGLKKFPNSNSLKLHYLLYSIRYLQNPHLSLSIMKQIDRDNLTMKEKFIYYRYSKIIEERLMVNNPNSIKLDINFEVTYMRYKNIFIKLIEKITIYLIEFWDVISRENSQKTTVEDLIHKINVQLKELGNIWKQILKLKTNDSKLIYIYERFLKNVLNDEQGAEDLLTKYIESGTSTSSSDENLLGDYEMYIQDGSGYIIASGSTESFGKILSFNPSFARLFNYTPFELRSKSLDILLPELIRHDHQNRLLSLVVNDDFKEKSKSFGRILAVGLKKTGYIFPVNLTATTLTGVNDSLNFLGLTRSPPSDNYKPYPIYFLTNTNLDIRNVSSEAIPIFGINSNNICYRNVRGTSSVAGSIRTNHPQYLNINLLVPELDNIKEDKAVLESYKSANGLIQKKKIAIYDTSELANILGRSTEKNKAVKILDLSVVNNEILQENSSYNLSKEIFNKRFKEYYISLSVVKLAMKMIGYIIKFEPITEENFLNDTKNTINYEDNILSFNPVQFKFTKDEYEEEFIPKPQKKTNHINSRNINMNKLAFVNRKKKNMQDSEMLSQFCTNLLNYLYKLNNIKNYSDLHKVGTVIRVQGQPDKELPPSKTMRIEETIKVIDTVIKPLKGNELAFFEEEKNEQQNLLEKNTEDLLNFKGIEGWKVLYNKLRKSKTPNKIILLRLIIIFVSLIFSGLMMFYFTYYNNHIEELIKIIDIQNLTIKHANFIVDGVHRADMYMFYRYINESKEIRLNAQIQTRTLQILNMTNKLREIENIDDEEYLIYTNRPFKMLGTDGNEQIVNMNLIEIFIQLTNKLIGMLNATTSKGVEVSYLLYITNSNNVYIEGIEEVLNNLAELTIKKAHDFNRITKIFLIPGFGCIVIYILNIILDLRISAIKGRIMNLFFTIPERICWKYHANCEWFLKYVHDAKNLYLYKGKNEMSRSNNNQDVNSKENKQQNKLMQKAIQAQNEERNQLLKKRKISKINLDFQTTTNSYIVSQVLINFILFAVNYIFYLLLFLLFFVKHNKFIDINNYINTAFRIKTEMNLYSINQRQIYSNSGFTIKGRENTEFQEESYKKLSYLISLFIHSWYTKGRNLFKGISLNSNNDIFYILNEGACNIEVFVPICEKFPGNLQGFFFMVESVYTNLTQIYIDYIHETHESINPYGFANEEYLRFNYILIDYISPLIDAFYSDVNWYSKGILQNIQKDSILLIVLYFLVNLVFFFFFWGTMQYHLMLDITYSKTALLLIHPNDIKDLSFVMDYLKKEIYNISNT